MKKILFAVLLLLVGSALSVNASETASSAGLLLKQTTRVRAEGMGGAQTAVTTDEAGVIAWNPASLYRNQGPEVSAVYYQGLSDDYFAAADFDMAANKDYSVGAGLMMYNGGTIDLNSETGDTTSTVNAQRDFLATVTGAYHMALFGTDLAMGANLKFLQSTLLEQYSAFAVAADLGAQVGFSGWLKDLQAGLAVKNLGTPLKYIDSSDPLPSYALAGLAYQAVKSDAFSLLLAGDVQYDWANTMRSNVGAEIGITEYLFFRGGYKVSSDVGSFTVGLGFNFSDFQFDYAFSQARNV